MNTQSAPAAAMALHKAGRLEEAETAYRAVLAITPGNPQLLHLLGLVRLQRGDAGEAVACLREALTAGGEHPARLNDLGSALRAAGRFAEAGDAYRAALRIEPGLSAAWFGLAAALHASGRLVPSVDALREGLRLAPSDRRARFNLATLLTEVGDYDAAASEQRALLEDHPEDDAGWAGLAAALLGAGDLDGAEAAFRRSLTLKPGDPDLLCGLGRMLLAADRPEEAEQALRQALAARPDHVSAHFNLGRALTASGRMDESFLGNWLAVPGPLPSIVRREAIRHLGNAVSADTLSGGDAPLADAHIETLSVLPMLRVLLRRDIVDDGALERLLTRLRRGLWRLREPAPDVLDLTAALAWQCFLNEYVYAESVAESAAVDGLARELAPELATGGRIEPPRLALYGCYRPLHTLRGVERLADPASIELPPPVADLVRQQITEPLEERRIAASLESCTDITDEVSRAVREQYEDNPYPRWQEVGVLDTAPMERVLVPLFPALARRPLEWPDRPRILVAGCGTGHHAVATAQRFANCRVTGIDLSRASLAYAARKTREAGLANVDYRQGDILALGEIAERFDIIESAGVLHHMADPLAGWRVLRGLLADGGFMKIGLYSETGRRSIVAARELIAERGYGSDASGIRAGRAALAALPEAHPAQQVTTRPDFYSMSTCRDMIFHVQEHRYSIPQIAAMIDALELEFLGFELASRAARHRYRRRFPDDETLTDLASWDRFEAQEQGLFAGMYLFWVRDARRDPSASPG